MIPRMTNIGKCASSLSVRLLLVVFKNYLVDKPAKPPLSAKLISEGCDGTLGVINGFPSIHWSLTA